MISCGPGAVPSIGVCVTSRKIPITRNSTSAATLTMANQNSISPNSFTETRLSVSTTASAISASTHCGIGEKNDQKCAYSAMAVMSAMPVVDQLRKCIQPATYAPFSPMNSRA